MAGDSSGEEINKRKRRHQKRLARHLAAVDQELALVRELKRINLVLVESENIKRHREEFEYSWGDWGDEDLFDL